MCQTIPEKFAEKIAEHFRSNLPINGKKFINCVEKSEAQGKAINFCRIIFDHRPRFTSIPMKSNACNRQ